MDSDTILLIVLGVVNIPVYILLGWIVFDNWENFWTAVGYALTPDAWSFLRGEWGEDWWAELRLGFLVACCAGCIYLEYTLLRPVILG